jgi:AcrR family transcriptional regulator
VYALAAVRGEGVSSRPAIGVMGRVKGRTRDRLYEAAEAAVFEKSYERATLKEIAESAGVPVGNAYYYFENKGDVLLKILVDRIEQITTGLKAIANRTSRSCAAAHGCRRTRDILGTVAVERNGRWDRGDPRRRQPGERVRDYRPSAGLRVHLLRPGGRRHPVRAL